MRLEWRVTEERGFHEARLRKPAAAAPGYTRNTVITEWLTLNCRGDCASRSGAASLRVRFRRGDDLERALAMFGGVQTPQAAVGRSEPRPGP